MFKKAMDKFGGLEGKRIAVLGVTFKPETDDLREAPSIPNIRRMLDEGAEIIVYDPVGINNLKTVFNNEIKYSSNIDDCLLDVDMAFIFTEWREIKEFNLNKFEELMKEPIIFDGRNCYEIDKVKECNLEYYSIGRSKVENYNRNLETIV